MRSLVAILVIFTLAHAYPSGPGAASCQNGFKPEHGVDPQPPLTKEGDRTCPYTIFLNTLFFTPGQNFTVNVTGLNGIRFKGFMLVAINNTDSYLNQEADMEDNAGAAPQYIGNWHTDEYSQTVCDSPHIIAHTDPYPRLYQLLKWQPPVTATMTAVRMKFTIVHQKDKFWLDCDPTVQLFSDDMASVIKEDTSTSFTTAIIEENTTPDGPEWTSEQAATKESTGSEITLPVTDGGAVNASATVTEESETTTESMIADTTELSESGESEGDEKDTSFINRGPGGEKGVNSAQANDAGFMVLVAVSTFYFL